ncbi:hypothetical protein [Brevundimonas pishanensis]|uniref:hypothetical protein n=1 Tax=Brevundimonas pishanensis TaxID=2896315 RepID=UPI001FA7A0C5|nr:hypothetical protein [Brevundimonas pishanensis]
MSLTPAPRKRKGLLASVREPLRTILILIMVVVPAVWGGLALVIGLLFLSESMGQLLSFEQAFNAVLSLFLILVFLPICHAGCHRWFWHVETRKRSGEYAVGEKIPPMWSEETEPAPPLVASPREKLAYALLYAAAIGLLLFIYLPLGHQEAIHRFIARYSSGRASAASLATIVIIWLPLIGGMIALFTYMERDMKKVRAGQVTGADKQRIELRLNWLAAFVTAVTMTGFMCYFLGSLVLRYLA